MSSALSATTRASVAAVKAATLPISMDEAERKAFLRRCFDEVDVNKNGTLDIVECAAALQRAHLPSDRNSVLRMRYAIRGERFVEGAQHQSGRDITYEDYERFFSARVERLAQHFDRFCVELQKQQQKGAARGSAAPSTAPPPRRPDRCFRLELLKTAVEQDVGRKLSDRTVRKVARMLDLDGDGTITLDEWLRALLLVPDLESESFLNGLFTDFGSNDGFVVCTRPAAAVDDNKTASKLAAAGSTAGDATASSSRYILAKKAACGAVSGALSRLLTAPIDRVRVVMQCETPKPSLRGAVQIILQDGTTPLSKMSAFFRGNAANTIKIAPEMAVKLTCFDAISNFFMSGNSAGGGAGGMSTTTARILAGGASGFLAECVSHPLDVVRTRIAASHRGVYRSIPHCASVIWKEGGVRAFYAGMVPSCIGIVPFAAIDLSANQMLRERARVWMKERGITQSMPIFFLCGCTSSATAMSFTFPLYTLKTRIAVTNEGLRHAVLALSKEGVSGFYRGCVPALLKVMPASGISYASYSWLNERM